MATITLSYDGRNTVAKSIVKMLETIGVFNVLKDDVPNESTKQAIKELHEGKGHAVKNHQELYKYLGI